jgi:16S rRNA (guanine(527)-N(7))-methyltransferase RsmG
MTKIRSSDTLLLWQNFAEKNKLSDHQLNQFKRYYELLEKYNGYYNLTTVIELKSVIQTHFEDSLALREVCDLSMLSNIVDVGSGGGFPGIPLKIVYPHLRVTLIEVIHKKIMFLNTVIQDLGLTDIQTTSLDWRTFIRKADMPVDLFCARASLAVSELLRLFKPSSPFKQSCLVYWASNTWQPEPTEIAYIKQDMPYQIGHKKRRLIVFTPNNSQIA